MSENECKSLENLMNEAYFLSLQVGYSEESPTGVYLTWRDTFPSSVPECHVDKITTWADGLMHKSYFSLVEGRCSLNAILNFDIEKFEAQVKMDIQMMKDVLGIVGSPMKLTFEEMRRRGYTGKWAGM